jgi:hypothetical protein
LPRPVTSERELSCLENEEVLPMTFEISEFELAMFLCWLIASLLLILGMWVVLHIKQRRSPVGRLAPRRWLGV